MQNPALIAPGQHPVPMPNEMFLLSRSGLSFSAKSGRSKFDASGDLYLSTLRMVFVTSEPGSSIQGFDLPIATLTSESFNQPIFGANNLTGTSPPLEGGDLTEPIKWRLAFNNGGVGTFLPLFFRILSEMRRRMLQQSAPAAVAEAFTPAEAQQIVHAAFVDPSDPSKLYVSQPVAHGKEE